MAKTDTPDIEVGKASNIGTRRKEIKDNPRDLIP